MAQKSDALLEQAALGWLKLQVGQPQALKNVAYIPQVFLKTSAHHDNIVNVH